MGDMNRGRRPDGRAYLRGWAGASNLVALKGEPDEQGMPTWNLYLAEQPRWQEQRRAGPTGPTLSRSLHQRHRRVYEAWTLGPTG